MKQGNPGRTGDIAQILLDLCLLPPPRLIVRRWLPKASVLDGSFNRHFSFLSVAAQCTSWKSATKQMNHPITDDFSGHLRTIEQWRDNKHRLPVQQGCCSVPSSAIISVLHEWPPLHGLSLHMLCYGVAVSAASRTALPQDKKRFVSSA